MIYTEISNAFKPPVVLFQQMMTTMHIFFFLVLNPIIIITFTNWIEFQFILIHSRLISYCPGVKTYLHILQ